MADTTTFLDLARLAAPFPGDAISWRVGATNSEKTKGLALAYIDARDVMDRLDEVCGLQGWQCEYTPMPNGTTCCRIGILINSTWVWKSNGAGATGDVSKETEREMAEKGGYSDALKRAAVVWGVGRYLYALPSAWVAIEQRGRSYVIKDSEFARLRATASKAPAAATSLAAAPPAGEVSPPRQPPRRVNVIENPTTGKKIDTENARNQRPEWQKFTDRVQGFVEARDSAGLKAWFCSDDVAQYVAGWVFNESAHEHFESALDVIAKAERV
jgi:hypothetical protein